MQLLVTVLALLFKGTQCLDMDSFYQYVIRQESNNSACQTQKAMFLEALETGETWALSMLDAFGRVPQGVTQGHHRDLGMFDQCAGILQETKATTIRGKYCLNGLYVPLSSTGSLLFNVDDLQTNTTLLTEEDHGNRIKQNDTIAQVYLAACIPDSCLPSDLFGQFGQDELCQTKDETKELNAADIICLIFISTILLFMVISTIYDLYLERCSKESKHPILLAFSIYTNSKKIIHANQQPGLIPFLNGMRVLSTCWVILCHRYYFYSSVSINTADYENWSQKWYATYFWDTHLSVDTFFFITGVLVPYGFLKSQKNIHARFNVFSFYLHRYLRLTPPLAALYFIHLTIARRFTSGPFYENLFEMVNSNCRKHWWAFFLYIQNYAVPTEMCMNHTWYLSVDMQFFLLTPLLLLPIARYGKIVSYIVVPILAIITTVYVIPILYINDIVINTEEYIRLFYVTAHTRFPPWLLGIAFGAFVVDYQADKRRYTLMDQRLVLAIWFLVIAVMAFAFFFQNDVDLHRTTTKAAIFYPFQKTLWALGLWWICYACMSGNAFFINWFLSLPMFQVLSKVSYCTYLVHYMLIMMHVGYRRVDLYFNDYEAFRVLLADIFISFSVGSLWTLAFESPVVILEQALLRGKKTLQKPELQ